MLVAAELFNVRLMQVLGISLATMAVVSVAIFEFAIRDGVGVSMESGQHRTLKGEEYDTILSVESRGTGWIGSLPTTFTVDTGQLMKIEPLPDGRMRLRFLGKYAGRTAGVRVGISLTDPLKLVRRHDEVVHTDFILDTLPLSLLFKVAPRRLTVFGFGEQPTGYPGPGQELYGLDEYHSTMDTKDIIWKRVAKSPDEALIARVREASVRDVVTVGVVHFAERGEERAAWVDKLCEALGQVGKEVFVLGASVTLHYKSPGAADKGEGGKSEEEVLGITHARAKDVHELAEAVMACSVAPASRDIEGVVSGSDFIVTGLKELEDEQMAMVIAEKPLLLISEEASPSSAFTEGSVIWTGKENLFPLVRKMLEG
jgi:hypothetical protein